MTNKEAYVQKAQAKLDEWDAQLSKLRAQLSGASADVKIKLNNEIESLESKRSDMKDKLNKLRNASEDAWEDMKEGFESAWESVSTSFKDAVNRFK